MHLKFICLMVIVELIIPSSVFQYEEKRARNREVRRKIIDAHKNFEK